MQHRLVVIYWYFRTTYQFHLQGSSCPLTLEDGPMASLETLVTTNLCHVTTQTSEDLNCTALHWKPEITKSYLVVRKTIHHSTKCVPTGVDIWMKGCGKGKIWYSSENDTVKITWLIDQLCHIIIIIIYLSWSWATCWPVPVSRIQKSLQRSAMIPSASWGIVFHYAG